MSTIEKRLGEYRSTLATLLRIESVFPIEAQLVVEARMIDAWCAATVAGGKAADAIIDSWNAARAAMKFVVMVHYDETEPSIKDNHPGWWGCRYCGGEKYDHPELHTPATCPVAACQVVIAKMEGVDD